MSGFPVSFVLWLVVILNGYLVNSASLDKYGHYSVVVAIDEDTVQNSNEDYVKNIKDSMFDLSEFLNYTTEGKFLIQNIDILVPSHWNVEADETSASRNYEGADIKVSHKFYVPQVNNPNACGRPGKEITLPYNFFDSFDSGPYGRLSSALLTLFVRLRFGAWEEHGYPGDSEFPYFWKSPQTNSWEVNSCTDKPLNGELRSIIDNTPCGQDSDPLYPPSNDCRFFPNENQEASTSLMSYHYLGNINKFCDFSTHNRAAPTPQNFYCKFKSVKEVIELSSDFQKVTDTPTTYTPPQIRIIKSETSRPLLYILLDRGANFASTSLLNMISKYIENTISRVDMASSTVGIGVFPALDNADQAYSEIVPLSSLNAPESVRLINQTLYEQFSTAVGSRDYAAALRDTVLRIKRLQHKAGAAILIVKTAPENNWGALSPEYEVLLPIHDSNIRVYAMEIEGNAIQRGFGLENICSKSSGKHLKISSTIPDIDGALRTYFDDLANSLKSEFPEKNLQLIFKEVVKSGDPVIAVSGGPRDVYAYAIPVVGSVIDGPYLRDSSDVLPSIEFDTTNPLMSWDDPTKNPRNGMYEEIEVINDTQTYSWDELYYECESTGCQVMFVMFASVENLDKTYSIQISTSADATSGVVDLGVETSLNLVGSPYLIYAKIEENGTPLLPTPGLSVMATLYDDARTWTHTFELQDSGPLGFPDLKVNDGIYSGAIIPNINGDRNFKVFVTVKYLVPLEIPETTTESAQTNENEETTAYKLQSSGGKLFPIGQDSYFGCGSGYHGCWSKHPESQFLASGDLDGYLRIINIGSYKRFAHRTTDLRYTPIAGETDFTVTLEWTAPRTLLRLNTPAPEEEIYSYKARHSDNLDRLLHDFDNCESYTIENPRTAGNLEARNWTFFTNTTRYFALVSQRVPDGPEPFLYDSDISNVIAVSFQYVSEIRPTTTTTPGPVTPPSTTTTTPAPSTSITTSSSTINPPTTTSAIRTSVARETTTVPTTPRTTVVTESTTPPPVVTTEKVKHWYEEKKGIIALSVGAAALLLIILGGFFLLWFFKR